MNKKGMTLVEVIISVGLISVVMLFLFNLLLDMQYENSHASYLKENQVNRATIIKTVEEDLMNNTLNEVRIERNESNSIIRFDFTTFVTELTDETGKKIQDIGHEFGVTTGRPRRCGWFDAVTMKYAVLVGGLTSIALTKIDVFDTFDEIKICTAYKDKRDGKIYDYYPTDVFVQKYFEPIYETHEGWECDITGIREYDALPQK